MKLLHLAENKPNPMIFAPVFLNALSDLGELTLVEHAGSMSDAERASLIRQYPVLLTGWDGAATPKELARNPGRLRYICNVSGTIRPYVPLELIESGILVTNWGDCPAMPIAEGALALLLATLKDLHAQIQEVRRGGWGLDPRVTGGTIAGLNIGIYGCGAIGRCFIDLIRPFKPIIRVFDPYQKNIPDGCIRVASLDELFAASQTIVIHAGLSDETQGSVTAELLAKLPDHGVVINTARGAIIDQDALFAEIKKGRLRAGLDVTVPEPLPRDHECRTWENCIITAHGIAHEWPSGDEPPRKLLPIHELAIENLRRFIAGEPLKFPFDRNRYLRST